METNINSNQINIDKSLPPLSYQKSKNENLEGKSLFGFFKVLKLGESGWTSKYRLLVVTEEKASYYVYPESKGNTENFYKIIEKIYDQKKFNPNQKNSNLEDEYENLRTIFENNPSFFKMKEEMRFELMTYQDDNIEKENSKNWKHCIVIKEKSSDSGDKLRPASYEKIIQDTSGAKKKEIKKKNVVWVFDFVDNYYSERFKNLYKNINAKKTTSTAREVAHPKIQEANKTSNVKAKNKEEELKKDNTMIKPKEESKPYVEPDTLYLMMYNEVVYQYLLKSYYQVCSLKNNEEFNKKIEDHTKNNSQESYLSVKYPAKHLKLKYEFAIYQVITSFNEICKNFVKKIVQSMYTKSTGNYNDIYPIVFPNLTNLKKPEQAVFLYSIEGINFTVTWHQAMFDMKFDSKNDINKEPLIGAYSILNVELKNKSNFTDIITRMAELHGEKEMPRVPLCCLIDYLGFRVFCESDLLLEDGQEVQKKNEFNSKNYQEYLKDVIYLLANPRMGKYSQNLNSKSPEIGSNSNSLDKVYSLNYSKLDSKLNYKSNSFTNVCNFHNRRFKNFVEKEINIKPEIEFLLEEDEQEEDMDNPEENISINNSDIEENEKNKKLLDEKQQEKQLKNDYLKYNNFFTNGNIEFKTEFTETIKYIMDSKLIIEIKDDISKSNPKKMTENDNGLPLPPKRNIYFRTEFFRFYLKQMRDSNKQTNTQERQDPGSENSFVKDLKKFLCVDESNEIKEEEINNMKNFLEQYHINCFVNCLDTLFFKPYDSASLTSVFHNYGINMFYLGHVAQVTEVPHIRELCLIEMISRTCKKLICDIMASKTIQKFHDNYYKNLENMKGSRELATVSGGESLIQHMPIAFKIRYAKDYLQKCVLALPPLKYKIEHNKNKQNGNSINGLYRRYWHNYDSYNANDIKNLYNPKDEKNTKNVKDSNDHLIPPEIKNDVATFLTVLFDFKKNDRKISIYNIERNNKELWDSIFKRIKHHYRFDKKEICSYIDPQYISLPALLSSIRYHTGITINLTIDYSTRYNNSDLIGREFTPDMIDFLPQIKTISNYYFEANLGRAPVIYNDYNVDEYKDNSFTRNMILKYYIQKAQLQEVSIKTIAHLFYLYRLNKHFNNYHLGQSMLSKIIENEPKEESSQSYFKKLHTNNVINFESFHYLFLEVLEIDLSLENSHNTTNQNISNKNLSTTEKSGFDHSQYIKEFWFSKHPFVALLYIFRAKVNREMAKQYTPEFEALYFDALNILDDSLGESNIFVASLCTEFAHILIILGKWSESTKLYLRALEAYRQHKEEFFFNYMICLKEISKNYVVLGDYRKAMSIGKELVPYYIQSNLRSELEKEKFGIEEILYNLIKVAYYLEEWDIGLAWCNNMLNDIYDNKKHFSLYHFVIDFEWDKLMEYKNRSYFNTTIEFSLFLELYLKLIIKSLKENDRLNYIQAMVKLIETKSEREEIFNTTSDTNNIQFTEFLDEVTKYRNESFVKYFKNMLEKIKQKIISENEKIYYKNNDTGTTYESNREYNEAWKFFKMLVIRYKDSNVFNAFLDTEVYSYFFKRKK